ncbi:MAG: mechanosensitive ion channel [Phycisphaerales bacterium]|nr:MAG: mechanosensitive ion channel [Phycisphaerales bacterium]
MLTRTRARILVVTFVVFSILVCSVSWAAQSQPEGAPTVREGLDANSVDSAAPVPQGASVTDAAAQLTVEKLEGKKKQIAESQELSDEVKVRTTEAYDKAIAQLKSAAEFDAKRQQYSQARKEVPGTLAKTKELLAQDAAAPAPDVAADTTLAQADQALTAARLTLEEAKKNVANWESEPKRRADRRTRIPEETNIAKQKLEEIKTELGTVSAEGQPPQLTEANRALLLAQQRVLESQIAANTEELLSYDAAGNLLAARRDLAAKQLAHAGTVVEFWQKQVGDLRQREAEAARKEAIRAKEETQYDDPALRDIADENARMAQVQAELVSKIQAVTKYSEEIEVKLAAVQKNFADVRAKVETAGRVTDAMGMILLGHRDKLPHIRDSLKRIRTRPAEIALAQFNELDRDRQWSELRDLTEEIDAVLAQLGSSVGPAQREAVKAQATGYYESQRNMLSSVIDRYREYSAELAELDATERQYVQTVQEFADFLDANVLWVRSSPALRLSDLRASVPAIGWLLSPVNWYQTVVVLWADIKANMLTYGAVLLIVISIVVLRPKARDGLEALAMKVHQVQTDSFAHTVKALGLTVFLAVMWPVILFLLQWRLFAAAPDHDYSQAMASGLRALIPVVLVLSFLRHCAMPNGLAQSHLRVRPEPLSFMRHWLMWYFALAILTTLVVEFMQAQQTGEQWYNSAGRLFLIVGLTALALLLLLLLRPTGPLVEPFLKQKRDSWLERLRYFWYPLCFVLPAAFAVLAGMGYFYAARQLFEKFAVTLLLILLALLVRAMFVRWLMVAQRRLALLERQKREAAEQEAQEQAEPTPAPESQQGKAKDEATIFQISQQTRRLIDVITVFLPIGGIWFVWSDFLPALSTLAQTELWRMSSGEAVTLGSLAMAVLVVALTIIVTRNVPGLLEIVILRKLPLDRGVRFAITTLFRYALGIVGIVWACTEIGIGWSKVQWLIAAMGVGLGFGLQEIFANFISGLIILFEQPIRVDDVVTIGEVTGKVAKIRIRATTIRRWDQRELVVPNKEFITGRLINWTLSDNVLRREFIVGIAYGSDTAKAEALLYEVARANPLVLQDPAPVVIFKSFGDNSLEFELRVYIAGIENYVPVWHEINCAIDKAFRQAGIEIAFPQRDIHIRSIKASLPVDTNKPQ